MNMKEFSKTRGVGPQMLVGLDNESEPGKIICHFVQMETVEFNYDGVFDSTIFHMATAETDPRFALVIEAIAKGGAP